MAFGLVWSWCGHGLALGAWAWWLTFAFLGSLLRANLLGKRINGSSGSTGTALGRGASLGLTGAALGRGASLGRGVSQGADCCRSVGTN